MTVKGSKLTSMRITAHNPIAKVLRLVALVGGFILAVGASYFAGVYQTNQQHKSQLNQHDTQQQKAVAAVSQEITQLRTNTDIDRQSIEDLRQLVMTQKAQISASERDLRVYKDLLSPGAKNNPMGISFGVFTVLPLKEKGHFNYSLTVQKLSTKEADFSGFLEFRIIGQQSGQSLQLSLFQVSSQVSEPSIPLSFKYFQTFEGSLAFPVDFVPQMVELVVKSKDNKPPPLVRAELNWPMADFKLK